MVDEDPKSHCYERLIFTKNNIAEIYLSTTRGIVLILHELLNGKSHSIVHGYVGYMNMDNVVYEPIEEVHKKGLEQKIRDMGFQGDIAFK